MSAAREYPAGVVTAAMVLRVREFERLVLELRGEFKPLAESEVEIAVDRAFEEIQARGELVEDSARFHRAWVTIARNRCKDAIIAPRHTRRLAEPPDAHDEVLERVASDDVAVERDEWAMEEFLHNLPADAQRLLMTVLDLPADRRKPRFINPVLGWGDERRRYVHKKLRAAFHSHFARRESGELCAEQSQLIDVYLEWKWSVAASAVSLPRPSDEQLLSVWLHLHACESCCGQVRAIDGATRGLAALFPPIGLLGAALAAVRGLSAGAKVKAATTLPTLAGGRGRAAGVGTTSGAAGGLLSGVGVKVAACGIAAVCIGGASTLVVGAGQPFVSKPAEPAARHAPAHAAPAHAGLAAIAPVARHEQRPPTFATVARPTARPRAQRRGGSGQGSSATPGDLGLWMTPVHPAPRATRATTRSAPAPDSSWSASAGSRGCTTPGDLGCP